MGLAAPNLKMLLMSFRVVIALMQCSVCVSNSLATEADARADGGGGGWGDGVGERILYERSISLFYFVVLQRYQQIKCTGKAHWTVYRGNFPTHCNNR